MGESRDRKLPCNDIINGIVRSNKKEFPNNFFFFFLCRVMHSLVMYSDLRDASDFFLFNFQVLGALCLQILEFGKLQNRTKHHEILQIRVDRLAKMSRGTRKFSFSWWFHLSTSTRMIDEFYRSNDFEVCNIFIVSY